MPGTLNNIGLLAGQNLFLAYFIIYLTTIFLGNISAFASLLIALRGTFGNWGVPLLLLTVFCSSVSGDLLWYSLGHTLRGTRFGNFVKNRLPDQEKIEAGLQKKGLRWVFISKFVYGSSMPILFLVGWAGMDFKKFFKTAITAILCWLPILATLAYVLTSSLNPLRAVATFKAYEVDFVLGFALFFVAEYFLAKLFSALVKRFWKEPNDLENEGYELP